MAPAYVPGLRLAREFYAAEVRPLLTEHFPQMPYAAALVGPGSEVVGFDTQRSVDHDWGRACRSSSPAAMPRRPGR